MPVLVNLLSLNLRLRFDMLEYIYIYTLDSLHYIYILGWVILARSGGIRNTSNRFKCIYMTCTCVYVSDVDDTALYLLPAELSLVN